MRIRCPATRRNVGEASLSFLACTFLGCGIGQLHCGPACPPERRAGNEKKTATANAKTQRNAMGIRQQRIAIAKGLSDPTKAL